MQCDHCKKNEAVVHIKEIFNGKSTTLHLCAECAAKKTMEPLKDFNLLDFLSEIKEIEAGKNKPVKPQKTVKADPPSIPADTRCPVCHWSLKAVQESHGKLGCPQCYLTFMPYLLRQWHKAGLPELCHCGKRPAYLAGNLPFESQVSQLQNLQQLLRQSIAREDYEQAAILRDKIAQLTER